MSIVIENGVGNANKLKVDKNNRAHVAAISESQSQDATRTGDSYSLNTGTINFEASGTLIYLKNNEDQDLAVTEIHVGVGIATTAESGILTLVRNPTGGDLISDATAVNDNQNRNFGSNKTLTADAFKGKSGGTVTGGNNITQFFQVSSGNFEEQIDFDLPKGSSLAISYNPNLASGSTNVHASIVCFLKDPANV